MALNDLAGSGTSLSANFYLRKFYTANIDAKTSSKRSSFKNSELSLADGMALRQAIKNLGSFEYDDAKEEDIRNRVQAYISTYNNTLSSLSKSEDRTLARNMKQLQTLTNEYSKDLDKIGITVKEDGTLVKRDSLFKTADIAKFEKLFSKDSDYMQRTAACGKRIERRSTDLCRIEQNKIFNKSDDTTNASGVPDAGDGSTTAAQIVAETMDLDLLLNTGIGKNVNVSL